MYTINENIPMHSINVTELRTHLQKYLASVHKGNEILVTLHGQVIAKIVPPTDVKEEAIKQLNILRKNCDVTDVISPIDVDWNAEK